MGGAPFQIRFPSQMSEETGRRKGDCYGHTGLGEVLQLLCETHCLQFTSAEVKWAETFYKVSIKF